MRVHTVCSKFLAFSVTDEKHPDAKEAERIARELLRKTLLPQWDSIEFDVFTSGNNAFYLAYPVENLKIRLAEYALPYINEYFTE